MLLAVQLTLGLAVLGKLHWDRATLPRVWARTVPLDPDDPLRGRYVRLWLDAADRRAPADSADPVEFAAVDGQLTVRGAAGWPGFRAMAPTPAAARGVVVEPSLAFYISEHQDDPSRLPAGTELWAEVTVPPRALPRPIRLETRQVSPPQDSAGDPAPTVSPR